MIGTKYRQFDIDNAKSGEYDIFTKHGYPVEVLKWDANNDFPIVGLIKEIIQGKEVDNLQCWTKNGHIYIGESSQNDLILKSK